ncbi:transcriptional regulator family: Fungal Specific TF [Paecilomyces variotii]|nr:transcriptional regulator family: Fungal Specific TF [Paecilomyces variotii]KAJ9282787.1 transcriptional regulator family: Fungal Specific TF [Paecilomyces variotii]KAJ9346832.1 transcriptional regulator family: Fungal Specific TF [Paecilomyces variotii]KAJ9393613.1 transcriptional regulator family: Fungal Specific TF [Paecilomyces variotii]
MVYGGRPSTGCHLCRRRKIKCDEARPTCRNCAVHGAQCPGYREAFVIRNETNKARQSVVKRRNPTLPTQRSRSEDVPTIGTVPTHLADSTWEERALCHFFDQYTVISDPEQHFHHLGFLPGLYALSKQNANVDRACSSLRWAVEATALSSLANRMRIPPLVVKARQVHGNALRSVNAALRSPSTAVRDETLAAVVLLSLFEDINGERSNLASSHGVGLHLLMKLRGEGQLRAGRGRSLLSYAFRQVQTDMLNMSGLPGFDLSWLLEVLDRSDGLQGLMRMTTRVSLFAQDIRRALTTKERISDILTETNLRSWTKTGIQLDLELSRWHEAAPETWLPRLVQSKSGEFLLTYQDISIASFWNLYRCIRIILQGTLLDITTSKVSRRVCDQRILTDIESLIEIPPVCIIEQMISDTCRSIPFCLGDVDSLGNPVTISTQDPEFRHPRLRAAEAYELLWPLWFIICCVEATPEQINQARTALSRLGSMFGIKLASAMAAAGAQAYQVPFLR